MATKIKDYLNKLKKTMASLLSFTSSRLLRHEMGEEYKRRVETVGSFIYEEMPSISEHYANMQVIEGGKVNIFEVEGELPQFSFILPKLSLYIYVGGIESSSWEEANLYGVTRENWNKEQDKLSVLESIARGSSGFFPDPIIWIIKWKDTLNFITLNRRFNELRSPEDASEE